VGINVIHERGGFARLTTSHVSQRFDRARVASLPKSSFPLADLELSYEFAGKRGLLTLASQNLFDERFLSVIEGLSVIPIRPERRTQVRWRL
jgi:hypothetical protein